MVILFVLSGVASPVRTASDLLPALVQLRSDLAERDSVRSGGRVQLRFTGTNANHGTGVRHITGRRDKDGAHVNSA